MDKAMRAKYGLLGRPIPATRVLVMDMPHFAQWDGKSILAINDQEGTFTAANVYSGKLGRNYDPAGMTHPLPAAGSEKWKEWEKKGYREAQVQDFPVLEFMGETAQT